ncbi:MAG: ferrous iron transport protein A [Clostridia bacterium]|nr:ferrous iron transport protein A [Clostridia bacterium]
MTLKDIRIGSSAVIKAVGGEGALRLRFLDMGIIPGTRVTVSKAAPLGDPIQLSLRGYSLTMRLSDAEMITVEEEAVK